MKSTRADGVNQGGPPPFAKKTRVSTPAAPDRALAQRSADMRNDGTMREWHEANRYETLAAF